MSVHQWLGLDPTCTNTMPGYASVWIMRYTIAPKIQTFEKCSAKCAISEGLLVGEWVGPLCCGVVWPWNDLAIVFCWRRHWPRHRRKLVKIIGGGHGERVQREPVAGVWGSVGSRGKVPGQVVRGALPPWSWKHFNTCTYNFLVFHTYFLQLYTAL